MDETKLAEHRRQRLLDFANKKYEGSKAALGRALGYRDGAFVGQMVRGDRPITEKTIAQINRLPGGAGWFEVSGAVVGSLKFTGSATGEHHPPAAVTEPSEVSDSYADKARATATRARTMGQLLADLFDQLPDDPTIRADVLTRCHEVIRFHGQCIVSAPSHTPDGRDLAKTPSG